MTRAYPGFNCSNNGRNARLRRWAFYVFDVLWSNGRDLTGKTVLQRRDRLEQIIAPVDGIQVVHREHGKDIFVLAKEKGLEGIIAKRKSSIYRPGKRSPGWLKIKSRPPKPAQLALYSMHIQPADFGDRRGRSSTRLVAGVFSRSFTNC